MTVDEFKDALRGAIERADLRRTKATSCSPRRLGKATYESGRIDALQEVLDAIEKTTLTAGKREER